MTIPQYERLITAELIKALKIIQKRHVILKIANELELNTLLKDLLQQSLTHSRLTVSQEDPGGESGLSGKNQGERDICFQTNDNKEICILEALKSYNDLEGHFRKIWRYDPIGYPFNFLLIYLFDKNLEKKWDEHKEIIKNQPSPYSPSSLNEINKVFDIGAEMRLGYSLHTRETIDDTKIIHIMVKIIKNL